MKTEQQKNLEARIKELNREINRVDSKQIRIMLKEIEKIEKQLGYTLNALYSCGY